MTMTPDIWAALPVPALLIDADGAVIDVNSPTESLFNRPARQLRGTVLTDLLSLEDSLLVGLTRAQSRAAPLFVNDVTLVLDRRGPVTCALRMAPLPDAPDNMLLLIIPQELSGLSHGAPGTKGAAKSAIGMAEMLAHEIKNPLAGITGAAQLLAMDAEPEQLELTSLIVGECQRVVKLLDQVEQFGNLSPPALEPINLHDVLDRARRSALLGFAAGLTIAEDYDPSLPYALADADQLLQVVLNLVKNAAQAIGDQPGTITLRSFYDQGVRLRLPDGRKQLLPLQIEISDTGPGLPDDLRDDIFDPFVSGRENGTGLGLALVSKIISDHEGRISVTSRPGHTAFRVSLPRAPEED